MANDFSNLYKRSNINTILLSLSSFKTKNIRKQIYILIVLIYSLLCACSSKAQTHHINIKQFDVVDGLLHRNVSCLFEDKNGFIWIGLPNGLQRYDGYGFKSWTNKNKSGKIASITKITQDDEGWLWLWNHNDKLFVFLHAETEEIKTVEERFGDDFPIKTFEENPVSGWLSKMSDHQLSSGKLAFVCSNPHQLIIYDSHNGFQYYPIDHSSDILECKYMDNHGKIWLRASYLSNVPSQIIQIDTIGRVLTKIEDPLFDASRIIEYDSTYSTMSPTTSPVDLEEYYLINGQLQPIKKPFRLIGSHKWRISKDSISIYDTDNITLISSIAFSDFNTNILPVNFHFTQILNGKLNTWISSEYGLNQITISPNKFTNYFSYSAKEQKPFLESTSARGIIMHNDSIFSNLEFMGTFAVPANHPKQWKQINDLEWSRPIHYDHHNKFTVVNESQLVNMTSEGVIQSRSTIKEYAGKIHDIFRDAWCFYEDKNRDRLWVGNKHLAYKNQKDNFIQSIPIPIHEKGETKHDLQYRVIYHITPTAEGYFWLCTSQDLKLFDPQKEVVIASYFDKKDGDFFLPARTFYHLHIDKDNIHWISTNEGLIRWDRKTNKHQLFSQIDGLCNNNIYAALEDDYGYLWLSSDYGLMRFHKITFEVQCFLEKDGISYKEFNKISHFKAADGTMFFGGLNGITSFHPKDFEPIRNTETTAFILSEATVHNGAEYINKSQEIFETNTLTIRPSDLYGRLKFTLLDFEEPSRKQYAWRINSINDDWNYQKENTLQLGKLPYGEHVLQIKGQSSDGTWSSDEISIALLIKHPFYLDVWFLLMCVCVLFTSIWGYGTFRNRKLRKQQLLLKKAIREATHQIQIDKAIIEEQAEELKRLDKIKSRFFTNVAHELRTPLTLILGPLRKLIKSNNYVDNIGFTLLKKAESSSKDLLQLVNSIMDLSKFDAARLELKEEPIHLSKLVRRIVASFESFGAQYSLNMQLEITIDHHLVIKLDPEKFKRILTNLLSNAIKYSNKNSTIIIHLSDLGNELLLKVQDNGRGISDLDLPYIFDRYFQSNNPDTPLEGGTGIGLALCKELSKIMHGDLWVESEIHKGSTFFFQFPKKEILGFLSKQEVSTIEAPIHFPSTQEEITKQLHQKDNRTILVVEDNYSLRDYIEIILSETYNVLTAEDGLKALDILSGAFLENRLENIQLIVTDIMMPNMDGYQFLEVLKSKDMFRHIPVIVLSAKIEQTSKLQALRYGIDDYVMKPFDEDELKVRIVNLLKNSEQRFQLAPKLNPTTRLEEIISEKDQVWLKQLEAVILENMDDSRFNIGFVAQLLNISQRQLQRKIKQIVGMSPNDYLKGIRLQHARHLLQSNTSYSIKEIASKVGYADSKYFSTQFKAIFGKSPSKFQA